MDEHVGTHREEVRRLVFKYRKDIAYLEEKEEDLVRRIQILENLIPTVLIWFMWTRDQADKDVQFSQWTEEEAMNKLHHLETVLEELQKADKIMKKEESVLRKRIEELEDSLEGDPFANISVKPSSPLVSLTHDQAKSDIALMNKKIKKMNEERVQFVDFLEDSDRDWQKTCAELVNEVNNLRDILDQSNVKLKESTIYMKSIIGGSTDKDDVIKGKINDLENQTKSLYKEVIEQEKKHIAREESQEEKMFSMVQDAMDEVDFIKQVLKDSKNEKKVDGTKDVGFKEPVIHTITEEEEEEEAETDLGEASSPVVYPISNEDKPSPLVLDFQDNALSEDRISKQNIKIIAPLTGSEIAKESLIKGPTTSSIKYVDKPNAVEVDTATDIQLPPLAQVDQLHIGQLSFDNLSLQSTTSTKRASDSSVNKIYPYDEELPIKSDISLAITSQPVGDKYKGPSKLQTVSGEETVPKSAFLESFEEIPKSAVSVSQTPVLDSPLPQLATISSLSKSSPKVSSSQIGFPKPTISKTSTNQMHLPEIATNQASSLEKTNEASPLTLPDAVIPETTSLKTETVASKASHHRTDLHETVTSQPPLSTSTPETVSPLTSSSKAEFPKETSLTKENVNYKPPFEQTDPSTATPTKSSSRVEYSDTVPPPSINPEGVSSVATSIRTEKAVSKAPSNQTASNQSHSTDTVSKASSPPTNLPTPTPTISNQYQPEMSSKPEEQSSKSVVDSLSVIPGNASEPQDVPASPKLNFDQTAENRITPEPYEVPNTDGDFPTSSENRITPEHYEVPNTDGEFPISFGLMLEQQDPDNLRSQPNMGDLVNHTLQSKCRVKDHLIKCLADQLREQASGNIWSGNKLLSAVSGDPVKTYDFDRHTLAKYLKGEGPKDIDASLRSDPVYSNTNQLNVEVIQKLDQRSLIIKWNPSPLQEVVGFQIFIDGEFIYWVHSAKRNIALLQPLDLSKKHEIAVSPVDSKGKIILRSSVNYTPET